MKKLFEERYQSGKNRWFFTPLRVCIMSADTDLSSSKCLLFLVHANSFWCASDFIDTRPCFGHVHQESKIAYR